MNSNRINHIGKILDEKKEREQKVESKRFDFQPKLAAVKMNNKILDNQKKKNKNQNDDLAAILLAKAGKMTAMRARSVSKDYKLFVESQNYWR